MKHLYFILALALFTNTYAQDPDLLGHPWYMHQLVVNGTDYYPPSNWEVPYVAVHFDFNNANELDTFVCNSFNAEVNYNGTVSFTLLDYSTTLIFCNETVNDNFESLYFGFFFDSNFDLLQDPFPYTITTSGNDKTLVITNVRGDEAIYGDKQLSNETFEAVSFTLHPNPAWEVVNIQSVNASMDGATVDLFDITGKALSPVRTSEMGDGVALDVSHLSGGLYFMTITNIEGHKQVLKFIKE